MIKQVQKGGTITIGREMFFGSSLISSNSGVFNDNYLFALISNKTLGHKNKEAQRYNFYQVQVEKIGIYFFVGGNNVVFLNRRLSK